MSGVLNEGGLLAKGAVDIVAAGRYDVRVLYLDNHLLAVEKPANMPVQADSSGDMDMLNALKDYIARKFDKPGKAYLGLVHRLDRPVGGAMVLARTSKAAARLSKQFSDHKVKKIYLAVTKGEQTGEVEMEDWLLKDERTGMVRAVDPGVAGAKRATLRSKAIASIDGATLREVELFSGRPHQIRVQHASRGWPVWGDARYDQGRPGCQIALWSARLTIEHPVARTPVTIVSRPPDAGIWTSFSRYLEDYYGK
ncbi:MAG: RNA pseudouridine synthase [Clostridia bacterium]|nr:RNA pseudouridine synthase [Clostridia bacterium]